MPTFASETSFSESVSDLRPSDFSPTGEYLAYGSADGNFYVRSVGGTWPLQATVNIGLTTWSMKFSRSGEYLAAGWSNGGFGVWRTSDWTNIFTATDLTDHVGGLGIGISWSPNDSYVAAPQRNGNVAIYETATWTKHTTLQVVSPSTANVYGTAFDPSGGAFAYCSFDNEVYVYDFDETTGAFTHVRTLSVNASSHYAVSWTPDGSYLAATTYSGGLAVWNTADWSLATNLQPQGTAIADRSYDVKFGPQGNLVMHGSRNGIAYVHEVGGTWPVVGQLGAADAINVYGLSWHPGPDYVGTAKGSSMNVYSVTPDFILATATGIGSGAGGGTGIRTRLGTGSGMGSGTGAGTPRFVRTVGASGSGIGMGASSAIIRSLIEAIASGIGAGSGDGTSGLRRSVMGTGSGVATGSGLASRTRYPDAAGNGVGGGAATLVRSRSATANGAGTGVGTGVPGIIRSMLASGLGSGTGAGLADVGSFVDLLASGSGTGSGHGRAGVRLSAVGTGSGAGFGTSNGRLTRTLAGIVTLNGTGVAGAPVYVVDSSTNDVVARVITNADGTFSYVVPAGTRYHVTTQHATDVQQYNARSKPFLQT